jgi:hypothetical protein
MGVLDAGTVGGGTLSYDSVVHRADAG